MPVPQALWTSRNLVGFNILRRVLITSIVKFHASFCRRLATSTGPMQNMSFIRAVTVPARYGVYRTCRYRPLIRLFSSDAAEHEDVNVAKLLEQPTWSVASLISADQNVLEGDSEINVEKLRLLLRPSALPFPTSAEEQAAKLKALRRQLHFVRDIQTCDTTGLSPLQAIRDETQAAVRAQSVGLKDVEQTLLQEVVFGHNKRPRRLKPKTAAPHPEEWNTLDTVPQKAGRYIVVNGVK